MRFKSGRFISMLGVAGVFVVGGVLPMWAHHSHGNYEDTFMDIEGVVKEVHLVVPHSWIYLEVKDAKGEPQMWAMEATGRTGLQRIGVTADYVKPGDAVKARCHHLRDVSNCCFLGFLKANYVPVKDLEDKNAPAQPDL